MSIFDDLRQVEISVKIGLSLLGVEDKEVRESIERLWNYVYDKEKDSPDIEMWKTIRELNNGKH